MDYKELLISIENIEDNFRLLDNVFRCMNIYHKGKAAEAIADVYGQVKIEIDVAIADLRKIKESIGDSCIRKLPGDIF